MDNSRERRGEKTWNCRPSMIESHRFRTPHSANYFKSNKPTRLEAICSRVVSPQVDGVEAELLKGNDNVLCCVYWKESDFSLPRSVISLRCYLSGLSSSPRRWYLHKCQPNKIFSLISSLSFCCSFTRISSVKKCMARSETKQHTATMLMQ